MKVLITSVCTGKPDGVTEIVYTDGREYDLPEGLAERFIKEGKATTPPNPLFIKEGVPKAEALKNKKEVRDGKE